MQKENFKNILVIKNRALGDSVFGLSVLKYLKNSLPHVSLTYAIPTWISRLYQNVQVDAETILPMDLKSLGGQLSFLNAIRIGKFDAIIELHESPRSIRIVKLARFLFGIPYFTHNHHLDRFHITGIFDQGIRKAITQRDLDGAFSFLRYFHFASEPPSFLDYLPEMRVEISSSKQAIVLGIVATRIEKKWPIAHFARLIELLSVEFPNHNFIVPVSPSEEDQTAGAQLLSMVSSEEARVKVHVLTKPLCELPIALSGASIYVGNDTGIKHICAALGVRTVTIFGPEEPLEWHPYETNEHPYFWIYGNDVRTKMLHVCLLKQFDQSKKISEILPNEVAVAVRDLIKA